MDKPAVLVVDDETEFREQFISFLRLEGWTAVGAADGEEALQRLESGSFDGMVLDRSMPRKSGDEVLRAIRGKARYRHLCKVVFTAYGDPADELECRNLGAWQFLKKPKSFQEILSFLQGGIALHRLRAERRRLLSEFDRAEFFLRLREVVQTALGPEVHIFYVDARGTVKLLDHQPPRKDYEFVRRILDDGKAVVTGNSQVEVLELTPVNPDTKTLMAVPVPLDEKPAGVASMESSIEHAFPDWWREVLEELAEVLGLSFRIVDKHERERADLLKFQKTLQELRHQIASHSKIVFWRARQLATLANVPTQIVESLRRNAESIEYAVQHLKSATIEIRDLKEAQVGVDEIVTAVCADMRFDYDAAGATLTVSSGDLSCTAIADTTWFPYVLVSLLKNAVEAIQERRMHDTSAPGSTYGNVSVAVEDLPDRVLIRVADDGVGFRPEIAEDLFLPTFSSKVAPVGSSRSRNGYDRVAGLMSDLPRVWDKAEIGKISGDEFLIQVLDSKSALTVEVKDLDGNILASEQMPPWIGDVTVDPKDQRGIGLYTARRVIQELGGSIRATSEGLFKGATFEILLRKAS